jgi:hypothetical protein
MKMDDDDMSKGSTVTDMPLKFIFLVTGCSALLCRDKSGLEFFYKMNEVIIEVHAMSTCIHECMTAI